MNYLEDVETITFIDKYDFDFMEWEDTFSLQSIIVMVNNFAFFAQAIGAIVPYKISVTVNNAG